MDQRVVLALGLIAAVQLLSAILIKRFADRPGLSNRMRLYFGFAALYAAMHALVMRELFVTPEGLMIGLIGVLNSYGAYAEMRANRISMSKTALFLVLPSVVEILLAVAILGELQELNPPILAGVVILLGASFQLRVEASAGEGVVGTRHTLSGFIPAVLAFVLIYGIGQFSMRYFSVKEEVSSEHFVLWWYLGSFLGALICSKQFSSREEHVGQIGGVVYLEIALLSLCIWGSRYLGYVVYGILPVVVAGPLVHFIGQAAPLLVGLFVFRERREMSFRQAAFGIAAVLGSVLILYGAGAKNF